jgi:uncharacterized membrane protein
MKNKIKSLSFWLELNGVIIILIDTISSIFGVDLYSDKVQDVLLSICAILIVLGVITKKNVNDTEDVSSELLMDEIIIDDKKEK